MARFNRLVNRVEEIRRKSEAKRLGEWLDSAEVCRILQVSPRTLQTLRDNRLIACSQIDRKFFYRPEEVERLLPLMDCYRTRHDQPIKSDER